VLSAPRFTEQYRQELRLRGRRSLYFFGVSILGFSLWSQQYKRSLLAPVHAELAAFLEGRKPFHPWRFALVFMPRGGGKSIWTTMTYPTWRTLYGENATWRLIENSDTNAFDNHFRPMLELFTESPRAEFLQWLYREEIPTGFRGWNSETINWNKTQPEVGHSLSYSGLGTKKEGSHPLGITADDLEGTDAEKGDVTSAEAWRAYQNAIPLLRDPAQSQLLVVGTPHGPAPFLWRLRESELGGEIDNVRRQVKVFWRPLLDETESYDSCIWKERFPEDYVEWLKKQDIWDQQYMGRKRTRALSLFDMDAVKEACYRRDRVDRRLLDYESIEFDPDNLDDEGFTRGVPQPASVHVTQLRTFLHIDPIHKTDEERRTSVAQQRPAEAAMVIVGVAADFHAFVLHCWQQAGVGLDVQAEQAFRLYCLYGCHLVTVETVGAQAWFRTHVQAMERAYRATWGSPKTVPGPVFDQAYELPLLSSRLIAAEKSIQSKDSLFRERLAPRLNRRLLHLNEKEHSGLLRQLEFVTDESVAVDLVDALSQGAGRIPAEQKDGNRIRSDAGKPVWSAPLPNEYHDRVRRRRKMTEILLDKITGWAPVWSNHPYNRQ
jgi:hypothetical protein